MNSCCMIYIPHWSLDQNSDGVLHFKFMTNVLFNNKLAGVSKANRECLFLESKNFLSKVKYYIINYIFKLCFQFNSGINQHIYFVCTICFFNDSKYIFSPIIISGSYLLSLIIWWLNASTLAQIICVYSSSTFKWSNIYAYLSLRSTKKDDKECISELMVAKTIPPFQDQIYFDSCL